MKSLLLYIGISIIIEKELDHLLVASACAMKQSGPSSTVLQLQISTLLMEYKKKNNIQPIFLYFKAVK